MKPNSFKKSEVIGLAIIYLIIIVNILVFRDKPIAALSAFFGITYTFLAGKGIPTCYLYGLSGSALYGFLSFTNNLWGNLCLYLLYYIPMQILGFFKWNKNLKQDKREIVKTCLTDKERIVFFVVLTILCVIAIPILYILQDRNPVIDSITTIFSIAGMYLTVRRCIEQWLIWIIVNGLSVIMWADIALNGEKVYSTVLMWFVYTVLAVYFYFEWKKDLKSFS